MSDPIVPDELKARAIVEDGTIKVMSPSPMPGEPQAQRRREDIASYSGEWVVLIGGVLTWLSTFFVDMAAFESWSQILTPKFVGLHVGQLAGVIAAIVAAKRIK